MILNSQSYTFDQRPAYPLFITAKRYWDTQSPYLDDPSAVTLIFAHATGYSKELWEPVIDDFISLCDGGIKVREMWSVDAPNHGDAFIANEKILKEYHPKSMWAEYGHTVHAFLTGIGRRGSEIDFTTHRLVGIGNCMGAVAFVLSLDHNPGIHYESLILCEIATMHDKTLVTAAGTLTQEVIKRPDSWASREEAYNELRNQSPWKAWDERVLRAYVEGALRPLPTPHYPDKKKGVTLKCTRVQEITCYADLEGLRRVYASLGTVSRRLPVHMIYGAVKDYPAKRTDEDDVEKVFGGLDYVASFLLVEGAGHHVAQVNPKGLARKIREILGNTQSLKS